MRNGFLILCLLAMFRPTSFADDNTYNSIAGTGASFLGICAVPSQSVDDNSPPELVVKVVGCSMYVEGVMDGGQLGYSAAESDSKEHTRKMFCLPKSVSHIQMLKVVVKDIQDHPKEADMPSGELILEAIVKKFPCR